MSSLCINLRDAIEKSFENNADLDIIENLNNGVAPADIVANVGSEALYGLDYGGGYIFHFDENDNQLDPLLFDNLLKNHHQKIYEKVLRLNYLDNKLIREFRQVMLSSLNHPCQHHILYS